ncbi:15717_t:CDS:1, partial [Funneliformis geosporum]
MSAVNAVKININTTGPFITFRMISRRKSTTNFEKTTQKPTVIVGQNSTQWEKILTAVNECNIDIEE